MSMKKRIGLRRRWLINTGSIVAVLGLLCVLSVTAVFANLYYTNTESDMHYRARTAAVFLGEQLQQSFDDCYRSCMTYAQTFEDNNGIQMEFVDPSGSVAASSYGAPPAGFVPTQDIFDAMDTRGICTYRGVDENTGVRVMSVSGPVIYPNGQIVGVLRYVTQTDRIDRQVIVVALTATAALLIFATVMLASTNFHINSILIPLEEITEKARRIAAGSYGIQIQSGYHDEMGDLAETINELSSQISQNEKTQAEFISSLSHELRTPLTAINGWSETILSGESLDADTSRGVKIISREAKRLTEMVVDLLDFTRIQDGRMTLNVESTDIRGEFEDTVFMYGSRLAQEGVELYYLENDDEIPEIPCDPKRLRQVLLNLLDNAAKHGGEGKRIDASIHCQSDVVEIRVRDYGPGIPEDEIPLVKKKFYKGSSKARGSGIGLAVSDEIIQMHGGSLSLSNAPDGGTVVTVRLPAAQ